MRTLVLSTPSDQNQTAQFFLEKERGNNNNNNNFTFQINTNQLEDQLVPTNERDVLSQSRAFLVAAAEKTLFG